MKKYLYLLLVLFLYSHANAYVVDGTYKLLSIDDTTLHDKYIIAFYNANDTVQVLSYKDTCVHKPCGRPLKVNKKYYLTLLPTSITVPTIYIRELGYYYCAPISEKRESSHDDESPYGSVKIGRKLLNDGESFYEAVEVQGIRYKGTLHSSLEERSLPTKKRIVKITKKKALVYEDMETALSKHNEELLYAIANYINKNNTDTFYVDFYHTCRNDSVVCEKISNIEDYLMGVMKKTNLQILHFYLIEAVYKNKNAKNLSYVGYGVRTSVDNEYQFGNKYLHADRFNHKYDTYAIPINCNVK